MKSGFLKILFRLYIFILLLFFYRNALFWLDMIIYKKEMNDIILHLLFITLDALSFVIILGNIKYILFKGIHLIAGLWILFMILVFVYNSGGWLVLMRCILWPLLFEVTYIFSLRINNIDEKLYKFYLAIICIGLYVFIDSMLAISFSDASNMIYFVLLTGPFILLVKNTKFAISFLVILTCLAIISSKRSMMLALILFWFIIGIVYIIRTKRIILTVIFGTIITFVSLYSFQYIERINGGSVSRRMDSEDITSGREIIYEYTWSMILNSSIDHIIWGNGHQAVKRDSILDKSAHNEWLEILYDYGAIMLFIYLCLWIYMIKKWCCLYKNKSKYFLSYTLCICIWAVMSITSQLIIYVSYVLYLFMFIAFIEANTANRTKILQQKYDYD